MTAPTKGSGLTWVGRSIRRVEDPALLTGRGRFTADLPAAHRVRFVRSPVAAGRIDTIALPDGATVFTAADLAAVKPIVPALHKFGYVPVAQPVLATDVVRFVGEPIAAVVAATEPEAEDIADDVTVTISEMPAIIDARAALLDDAPHVHTQAARNLASKERWRRPALPPRKPPRIAASPSKCARTGRTRRRSKRAPAMPSSIRFRSA